MTISTKPLLLDSVLDSYSPKHVLFDLGTNITVVPLIFGGICGEHGYKVFLCSNEIWCVFSVQAERLVVGICWNKLYLRDLILDYQMR